MTKVIGTERSDTDILLARTSENYNLTADDAFHTIHNLGIIVPAAGDYLIEGMVLWTTNELTDAQVKVQVSSGEMVADFTVNDPDAPLEQVQVHNQPSYLTMAQGQHAWRMTGTIFGIAANGLIELKILQDSTKEAFLMLRGGFLRVTKLN